MPLETLDYRYPSRRTPGRQLARKMIVICDAVLLGMSMFSCVITWNTPRRFIFLPGGDVGLGFRSYGGALQWVEYAPWDPINTDFAHWSISWAVIFAVELLPMALLLRRRSDKAERSPGSSDGNFG
jgi:hypothetical protein